MNFSNHNFKFDEKTKIIHALCHIVFVYFQEF